MRPRMPPLDSRTSQTPAITVQGQDGLPLTCSSKSCSGSGYETLKRWLGEDRSDVLFLHGDRGEPLVLLSQDAWARVARTIVRG
jgi:hypothetical protein